MKEKIKKLNLNKRTISNLNTIEMNQKVGGATQGGQCTYWCDTVRLCTRQCGTLDCGATQQGHTCNGNNC